VLRAHTFFSKGLGGIEVALAEEDSQHHIKGTGHGFEATNQRRAQATSTAAIGENLSSLLGEYAEEPGVVDGQKIGPTGEEHPEDTAAVTRVSQLL
jgi:hypothetical protein